MRAKAPDLTLCDPPAPSPQSPPASSGEPFHVAKGVDIGELRLTLQAEGAKSQGREPSPLPAARANPAGAAKAAVATPTVSTFSKPATTPKAPPAQAPQFTRTADLDNTQTIRALTSAELSDDAQEKWFTVELASSEHPVNLDAMPHLDIFEAYRLYSVATTSGGKILHSLRLGFFKEAVSVEAVCGYLKTFFASPAVLRVSIAEYTRFKDAPMRKAVDARGSATVVELSDARASRGAVPTVTMEVSAPRTSASGSSKTSAGGSHQALTPTLKPAAKSAGLAAKRSDPLPGKSGATGKHKTLEEQLLEEAREVELSQSGIRKLPKNDSLLSKLVGKLTK
ncbi:MAG TPA: hypothetical protein VHK24_15105 [Steroidobacter sp.]|nr:hypothetical protein [Steroidobacter sp.]